MQRQAEVSAELVDALELRLPQAVDIVGGAPIRLELGPVIEEPLDGKLHEAGVLAAASEHVGHVVVHEVAGVPEAQAHRMPNGAIRDQPGGRPVLTRAWTSKP